MTRGTPVNDELQRRIAELEKKAGQSGSLWDAVLTIIPAWLAVATIAGILGFKGWEYYQKAQQEAAKTQLREIEAQIAGIEARASTSAEPQKLKAELEAKQEEARQARIQADAANTKLDEETAREKEVRAELDAKNADADKTRLEAQAMNAEFEEGDKLESRLARAKLASSEIRAASERAKGAIGRYGMQGIQNPEALNAGIQGLCQGLRWGREIGCPSQFWPRETVNPTAQLPHTTPTEAAVAAPVEQERFATVATLGLNLRKCPEASKACPPLTAQPLRQGTRLKYLGDAGNGWAKLQTNLDNGETIEGFANAKYLRF